MNQEDKKNKNYLTLSDEERIKLRLFCIKKIESENFNIFRNVFSKINIFKKKILENYDTDIYEKREFLRIYIIKILKYLKSRKSYKKDYKFYKFVRNNKKIGYKNRIYEFYQKLNLKFLEYNENKKYDLNENTKKFIEMHNFNCQDKIEDFLFFPYSRFKKNKKNLNENEENLNDNQENQKDFNENLNDNEKNEEKKINFNGNLENKINENLNDNFDDNLENIDETKFFSFSDEKENFHNYENNPEFENFKSFEEQEKKSENEIKNFKDESEIKSEKYFKKSKNKKNKFDKLHESRKSKKKSENFEMQKYFPNFKTLKRNKDLFELISLIIFKDFEDSIISKKESSLILRNKNEIKYFLFIFEKNRRILLHEFIKYFLKQKGDFRKKILTNIELIFSLEILEKNEIFWCCKNDKNNVKDRIEKGIDFIEKISKMDKNKIEFEFF